MFSTFHFLILLCPPFYREMRHELSKHGLEYLHFPVPTASIFPDELYALYEKVGNNLAHVLSSATSSVGTMAGVLGARLRLGPRGTRSSCT